MRDRDQRIAQRIAAGEKPQSVAQDHNMSVRRIYQIYNEVRRRQEEASAA